MRVARLSLTTLLLTAALLPAQAQNIVYYDDANPTTGPANAFPFGSEGVRIQQLVPQSVLGGGALIQDLFVAPAETSRTRWTTSEVVYDDFEIRMGITTSATLSTSWANNLPNPTTVYRGPLRVRYVRDQWVPIGLPQAYRWAPTSANDNLVVDFIFWRIRDYGSVQPDVNGYFMWAHSSVSRSVQRAFLIGWTRNQPPNAQNVDGNGVKIGFLLDDGNFVAHGGGCVGSSGRAPAIAIPSGTWPQIGRTMTVELVEGPASSLAFLEMGWNNLTTGGLTLPFDLAPIGAPGCFLWHEIVATFPPVNTDPTGAASVAVPVPNDLSLLGVRLYASWLNADGGANGLGFTTSGFATIILGT